MPQVFGTAQATASASGRKLIFVGTNTSPFIRWGEISSDGEITYLPNPDVLPAGTVRGISVFPDGSKVVVAHDAGTSFTVYDIGDTSLTRDVDAPTLVTGGGGQCVHISKNGQQIAIGTQAGQFLYVYSYGVAEVGQWVLLSAFSVMPTTTVYSVKYNNSGSALVVAQNSATVPALAYTRSGSVYTNRTLPSVNLASMVQGRAVAWTSDNIVSVGCTADQVQALQSWSLSGTTFTKLADQTIPVGISGTGNVRSLAYTAGGGLLFAGLAITPYLQVLKKYGSVLDMANTDTYNTSKVGAGYAPDATPLGIACDHESKFVACATGATARKLWLYRPMGTFLDYIPCTDVSGTAACVTFYPRPEDV